VKDTLLGLTQTILSSMDSDEINSINDSVESQQVVKIIRSVYYDIVNRAKLPEHYTIFNLEASGTSTKPVLMYLPSSINKLLYVKYNNATTDDPAINMVNVEYLTLPEFLDRMDSLDTTDDTVESFTHTLNGNTYTFVYKNDAFPQFYTSFDDNTLIFDSYNSEEDTTLQKSKTRAYGHQVIPFSLSDTFTPDLDEEQFQLLLNEAKSLAWAELKQSAHPKAEMSARRGWSLSQKNKTAIGDLSDFDKLPSFGRK
jgi:hypothetical protein